MINADAITRALKHLSDKYGLNLIWPAQQTEPDRLLCLVFETDDISFAVKLSFFCMLINSEPANAQADGFDLWLYIIKCFRTLLKRPASITEISDACEQICGVLHLLKAYDLFNRSLLNSLVFCVEKYALIFPLTTVIRAILDISLPDCNAQCRFMKTRLNVYMMDSHRPIDILLSQLDDKTIRRSRYESELAHIKALCLFRKSALLSDRFKNDKSGITPEQALTDQRKCKKFGEEILRSLDGDLAAEQLKALRKSGLLLHSLKPKASAKELTHTLDSIMQLCR